MKKISIKLRITLWFTLFMLLLIGVVFGFMLLEGEREVLRDTKNMLTDMVLDMVSEIEDEGEIELDELDFFRDGAYFMIFRDDGELLYGRSPFHTDEKLLLDDGGIRTWSDPSGKSYYIFDVPSRLDNAKIIWIRGIMATTVGGSDAFHIMWYLLLIILPSLILVAAFGGYALVKGAFRPVRRIIASADRIAEGDDLKERIGLVGGKDEIYALAATFDGMLGRLEASFERERQFTSDVSHELRTPVAVMIAQCEYALENAKTKEDAMQALSVVLKQSEHISTLISQLLFLSRADRGSLVTKKETVPFSELFESVAEQTKEMAGKKNIAVFTDIMPDLYTAGDETMLIRLLLNLCENAVKYGKEGGRINLKLTSDENNLMGEIADDGIGIPLEHLDKIWNRFYQVDPARSSHEEGVGLGLSIVKCIAEAHGGSVAVESEAGEGTVFRFTLPKKK